VESAAQTDAFVYRRVGGANAKPQKEAAPQAKG
jgi:hypothetical protein